MTRLTLKSALLGFGLAVASIAGSTSVAQAEGCSFGFSVGERGGPLFHGGYYGEPRFHRGPRAHHRRHCTPRRALRKARRAGVRRARRSHINRRGYSVL